MKIKRSSWHYKISNFGRDFEIYNDTLCRYFWRGVFKLAIFMFVIFLFSFMVFLWVTDMFFISNTIMFIAIILCWVLPPIAVYKARQINHGKPIELPKENIVKEYLMAKKRKICPLIEYID